MALTLLSRKHGIVFFGHLIRDNTLADIVEEGCRQLNASMEQAECDFLRTKRLQQRVFNLRCRGTCFEVRQQTFCELIILSAC